MRVENLFFLDKKKAGLSGLEYLGLAMTEAGNDFGPDTAYGKLLKSMLLRVSNEKEKSLNFKYFIIVFRECTNKSWKYSANTWAQSKRFYKIGQRLFCEPDEQIFRNRHEDCCQRTITVGKKKVN